MTTRISQAMWRSPLLWGSSAAIGFYALVHAGVIEGHLVSRYFASHPVEYVTTAMFMIGLASLAIKAIEVAGQRQRIQEPLLGPVPGGGQAADTCASLVARLDEARPAGYLADRLRRALEHVRRRGTADGLDDELKYLADLDADRAHASYALVRFIIWAIPILGFLGTVIGITLAIANLSPQSLENSLPEVTAGLGVAFDTTALALALSIVLMFSQFLTDRAETSLLRAVEVRAAEELADRFRSSDGAGDPHLAQVQRMADAVLQATERAVARQAELWRSTIEVAHQHWSKLATATQGQLETALSEALTASLTAAADRSQQHVAELTQRLAESTSAIAAQQQELRRQGEVLLQVVDATGQVQRLEQALNGNLATLADARSFEQAVASMSAAVSLLTARLGPLTERSRHVDLHARNAETSAA